MHKARVTYRLSLCALRAAAVSLGLVALFAPRLFAQSTLVLPAGAALLSESGPVNGTIDPGETVTILFAFRASAGADVTNLVATLLASDSLIITNGQTKSYGPLRVNGPSASQPFTFTAVGTNGQQLLATFLLQDGSRNLGSNNFTFTLGTTSSSFTNSGIIFIKDNTNAIPYPSLLTVTNIGSSVAKATLTLNQLTHGSPSDIQALLVSPHGQKSIAMANAGAGHGATNIVLTFDDDAAGSLPQNGQLLSGVYQPTAYFPLKTFLAPAPAGPYATNFSAFNGSNPNGVWSLFVQDDVVLDSGAISNGWSLNLLTTDPVGATADVVLSLAAAPEPVVLNSNLTFSINITNYGPSPATSIVLTDALPSSLTYLSSTASQGSVLTNDTGLVTWTVGTLATNAFATLTLVTRAIALGPVTNSASVTAAEPDPYMPDNSATLASTVVTPAADLSLNIFDSPDPLFISGKLIYTLVISNLGPATAPAVRLTNSLPPAVTLVSASPSNSLSIVGSSIVFTNLGDLLSGDAITVTIVVQPNLLGTITDSANVSSALIDPRKANNFAAVKTDVIQPQVAFGLHSNDLVLAWPAAAATYVLESAFNLQPALWVQVTNPPPALLDNQLIISLPASNSHQFFRLRATTGP